MDFSTHPSSQQCTPYGLNVVGVTLPGLELPISCRWAGAAVATAEFGPPLTALAVFVNTTKPQMQGTGGKLLRGAGEAGQGVLRGAEEGGKGVLRGADEGGWEFSRELGRVVREF